MPPPTRNNNILRFGFAGEAQLVVFDPGGGGGGGGGGMFVCVGGDGILNIILLAVYTHNYNKVVVVNFFPRWSHIYAVPP